MAKVKLSENLFLEVAELERFRKFIVDDGWKKFAKSIVKSYGIVEDANNSYFKPVKPTGYNDRVNVSPGLAFDSNLNAIVSDATDIISIPNDGSKYWLVLSRGTHTTEVGTVNVTASGQLTGTGTKFTEVLRGQPNFPTKIRLSSNVAQNQLDFEVVKVDSDTSAILSGSFFAENNLKYSVVGTFTPGYSPLEANKMIYEFDDHIITLVASGTKPTVTADEFIIAKAEYDEYNILNVSDERIAYMFNSDYTINTQMASGSDPLVSLLQASIVSGINSVGTISCDLEMIFEHGYSISNATLTITDSANMLNIVSGSSNFLGNTNPPTDMFKGWLVINRTNMTSAVVTSNTGTVIYLDYVPEGLLLNDGTDELIVVPNFRGIEFQIKVNDNVIQPAKPFYFDNNISNLFTRARVYLKFPGATAGLSTSVTISMKYRMIDNAGSFYPYQNLAVASFVNTQGSSETLANSSFSVNLSNIEPVEATRNYS